LNQKRQNSKRPRLKPALGDEVAAGGLELGEGRFEIVKSMVSYSIRLACNS